jgi:hypothetical protein
MHSPHTTITAASYPPYFHVRYSRQKALIAIESLAVCVWRFRLTRLCFLPKATAIQLAFRFRSSAWCKMDFT